MPTHAGQNRLQALDGGQHKLLLASVELSVGDRRQINIHLYQAIAKGAAPILAGALLVPLD
jgi:hypothetical protein